jgi:hypothetical protein
VVLVTPKQPKQLSAQELSDLVTEGINAVAEATQAEQRDWTDELHGEAWKKEFMERRGS